MSMKLTINKPPNCDRVSYSFLPNRAEFLRVVISI